MLDDLQVRDVYITIDEYPNIHHNAPIGTAINMMHHVIKTKAKFRTLLVLDDDDHLKGYLSIRDLIRAVGPDYLHKKKPDVKGHQPFNIEGLDQDMSALAFIWQEGFTLKLHDELKKPVKEHMTLMEDSVTTEDSIAKCLYLMLFHDVLILPVVEEDHVIGVIRLIDLFDHIAENVDEAWLPHQ